LTPKQLTEAIAESIFEKKGKDVAIITMKKVTSMSDYFVVCSADSEIQVKAIADNIEDNLTSIGVKVWHREGYKALQWILLDYVDVVVHIFKSDAREFYSIEKLWGDAPIKKLKDPTEKPKRTRKTTKATEE